MTISEMLLPEFDQEMANTRKMLERVPDARLGWTPHEKSMNLGRLASHIADMPGWAIYTINRDKLELTTDMKPFLAANNAELIAGLDKNVAEARAAIAGASDEHLGKIWSLEYGGRTILAMPRAAVLRTMVMSHIIHHRGQLSVYLRLLDVPIPGMYGPSADDR